jgi:hypothetical protein
MGTSKSLFYITVNTNHAIYYLLKLYYPIYILSLTKCQYSVLDKEFAKEMAAGNICMKSRNKENDFPYLQSVSLEKIV